MYKITKKKKRETHWNNKWKSKIKKPESSNHQKAGHRLLYSGYILLYFYDTVS